MFVVTSPSPTATTTTSITGKNTVNTLLPTKTVPCISGVDGTPACPCRDLTFTSHIDLVSHLRIHPIEADEPEPGA
ncbi:hypothetical protein SprV_0200702300 [Sparganum proliferum]